MAFTVMLKAMLSLTVGLIFWFWAFLVFMVYSFMPISKMGNSIIFTVVALTIYLLVINLLLKKWFKETGWKNYLVNFAITLTMTMISLMIIDLLAKFTR